MNVNLAVVVVVPAHDEELGIADTLATVTRSLTHAGEHGYVAHAALEVVAHRCRDGTADAARRAVGHLPYAHVYGDGASTTVGQVRDGAARRGLARLSVPLHRTWVLSTDADTSVGVTWVADILSTADRHGAVGVVGLADLDQWRGTAAGLVEYDGLLAAKMHHGHEDFHRHDHVYGANLAVRADAYLDVGGFPDVPVGEDQRLVDTLASRGHRLSRTTAVRVVTSGRLHGRAARGLADHLFLLSADPHAP